MGMAVEQPQERMRAPFHNTNGSRIKEHPARSLKGNSQNRGQQRFYGTDVTDQHNRRIPIFQVKFFYKLENAFLQAFHRLARGA